MAITHIPYNPQADPMQYLAQALQQYSQASLARRQKQQFQKGLSPTMTPVQLLSHALRSGYDPQTAIGMAKVAPQAVIERPPTKSGLQAQEIIRLQKKGAAGTITKPEQNKLDKLLIGQPLVEIGLGKPAAAAERTAIAEERASIDSLNNLKQLFKEEFVGLAIGRVAPAAGLVGQTTKQQEDFMAATSAFKNMIIKQITGAQMSEPEAKRIMKQIPDITDPPKRWKAKWEQSIKNIERIHKRRLQVLEQSGLRVPGDLGAKPFDIVEQPQDQNNNAVLRQQLQPGEILVRQKSTGQVGAIPQNEFDPNSFERVK